MSGLGDIKWDELMSVPADYWKEDAKEVRAFLEAQVGTPITLVGTGPGRDQFVHFSQV